MTSVKNISKTFKKSDGSIFTALDNISLIFDSQMTIIAGLNGSGKTLLMKILAGLEEPSSGQVQVSEKIGLIFQDADSQILGDTPLEDVLFGLKQNKKLSKTQAKEKALEALAKVNLLDKADESSHFLSGGEKRRLAIASILALGRKTIIFDEPYSNLDYPSIKALNATISSLKENGFTIILLTHELEKCLALADKFVVLHKGIIQYEGSPLQALSLDLEQWGIHIPQGSLESLIWS